MPRGSTGLSWLLYHCRTFLHCRFHSRLWFCFDFKHGLIVLKYQGTPCVCSDQSFVLAALYWLNPSSTAHFFYFAYFFYWSCIIAFKLIYCSLFFFFSLVRASARRLDLSLSVWATFSALTLVTASLAFSFLFWWRLSRFSPSSSLFLCCNCWTSSDLLEVFLLAYLSWLRRLLRQFLSLDLEEVFVDLVCSWRGFQTGWKYGSDQIGAKALCFSTRCISTKRTFPTPPHLSTRVHNGRLIHTGKSSLFLIYTGNVWKV